MLFAAEPPASMEKSSSAHNSHSSRSRPRKERGAQVPARSHRQLNTRKTPDATSARKESKMTTDPATEVKLKTTVVDIDSVRDDDIKEENLGLLEAAECEDGTRNPKCMCSMRVILATECEVFPV